MIFDVIVRNGLVVLADRVEELDIGIKEGVIIGLEKGLGGAAEEVLDATGRIVMPGVIDVHVHFNEPGLTDWEGFPTGSAAFAAGGGVVYCDMPLNGLPPTTTRAALEHKVGLANGKSVTDYAFWGGLVPGNLGELEALAKEGVVGFKAFMSAAGGKQEGAFREVDDWTLYQGMKEIKRLDKILALHAESEMIIGALVAEKLELGLCTARDYLDSRPIIAELEAVQRALFYGEQTGCKLHFVHISSPEAVARINEAKEKGLDVTLETCPHYLVLTADATGDTRSGSRAKCAPPLRSRDTVEGLWQAVARGQLDMISSDHSPCPQELKGSSNWFEIWGGIPGVQSTLELMVSEGHLRRGVPLPTLARLLATDPARRFGLAPQKGGIRIGADGDLAIVDCGISYVLEREHLLDRHKLSPYIGQLLNCRVTQTLVRGKRVYDLEAGGIQLNDGGLWVRPSG